MLAKDIFDFQTKDKQFDDINESFISDMMFEGVVESREEAMVIMEARVEKVIRDYASRYSGMEPPKIMAFQDPASRSHVVVLASGEGMFFRFDIIDGKVVSEERYRDFRELMDEREVLRMSGFTSVDHRTYLQKNWKKILMWIVGGSIGVLVGGPLLMAAIVQVSAAAAFLGQWVAGIGAVVGVSYIMSKIHNASGDPSMRAWNA